MVRQRRLADLLQGGAANILGDSLAPVRGVAYDSRRLRSGEIFVAVPGYKTDGTRFIADAASRGAAAVVAERPPQDGETLRPWVVVDSARRALAHLACNWYEHPSHDLVVAGITGTNGKTTVTSLLESLLATRAPAGRWSTTLVRWAGHAFPTPRTTPEAPELQQAMRGMVDAGCWAAAIEVSSHALALHRVAGTRFAAAVFTNLSPDHLDFHGNMDAYLDAKAILFEGLQNDTPAVINAGDPRGERLASRCRSRVLRYGWGASSASLDYAATAADAGPGGTWMHLLTPQGTLRLRTPLFGRAMCENVIAAVATAMELGIEPAAIEPVVASFGGEPGRLQVVEAGQDFRVLVDFAHTPAALQAAIEAAREVTAGRLLVVFGCGGDRDRGKRPQMGAVAVSGADLVIVTSDNPRSEDPHAIIAQILGGMAPQQRAGVQVEVDRQLAIAAAIGAATADDCVLIAGKGHETEQTFAHHAVPFDDRVVAAEAIRATLASGARR